MLSLLEHAAVETRPSSSITPSTIKPVQPFHYPVSFSQVSAVDVMYQHLFNPLPSENLHSSLSSHRNPFLAGKKKLKDWG